MKLFEMWMFTTVGFIMGLTLFNLPRIEPPVTEVSATTEQLVLLHYIKNNTGHIGNEVNMEMTDGVISQSDYEDILKRVQGQINRDGLKTFYGEPRYE